jgi:hypothetical protein
MPLGSPPSQRPQPSKNKAAQPRSAFAREMKACIRTVISVLLSAWSLTCNVSGDNLTSGIAAAVAARPESSTRRPQDIPFSSDSVWNIGIGSNAKWGLDSDGDVQQLRSLKGVVNAGNWGQPIYFGTPSDPLVTVRNADKIYPVPPQRIHIPVNAVPAGPPGGDGHMAFYDSTQPTKLWSYFGVSFNNGRDVTGGLTAALGSVWDTTGDGVANLLNPGSDYNFVVGTITGFDLTQGAINHAVRVAIGRDALKSPGLTWTDNIPWPNSHEDYDGPKLYKGKIVAGSTFGIPANVDLLKLNLSQGGLMLAKALQNYGAIWRDSCDDGYLAFYSTPEAERNPLIRQIRMDLHRIVPHLDILRNQGAASVNGGGQPIVPHLPPVALTPSRD